MSATVCKQRGIYAPLPRAHPKANSATPRGGAGLPKEMGRDCRDDRRDERKEQNDENANVPPGRHGHQKVRHDVREPLAQRTRYAEAAWERAPTYQKFELHVSGTGANYNYYFFKPSGRLLINNYFSDSADSPVTGSAGTTAC